MDSFSGFIEAFGGAPFFPYQGSKANIRTWVIQFMPQKGRMYVEPFGGRGNMFFLAKQQLNFKKWQINDLNSSGFFNNLASADVTQMPDAVDQNAFADYKANRQDAWSQILEPEISHLGHYRGGYKGNYSKDNSWKFDKNKYADRVNSAKESLKDVQITNVSWDQLPYSKYGSQDFIYFDPPYLGTDNRYYKDIDHNAFLDTVKSLKARWMVSMVNHPLYVEKLGEPVAVKDRQATLRAVQKKSERLTECIWKGNY